MLSVRENFLQTIAKDGEPDRLVNGYEFMELIVPDPLLRASSHSLSPGKQGRDGWGVTFHWPEGQPAAAPLPDASAYVIKDVANWEEALKLPDIEGLDWTDAVARADAARGKDKFVTAFFISGLFERLHFLMGFENALVNLLAEPEATKALIDTIGAYRKRHAKLLIEKLRPEMFFLHDDWGMKHSLFMSPEVWREMIRPHYEELYAYIKSEGILIVHHADSFLEPIVSDMAEIGIDVWQGALPENDIVRLQTELDGRMTLMGGIDAAIVDTPDTTEEAIIAETRRACAAYGPGGHFIPSITYGGPNDMIFKAGAEAITDAVRRHNLETFGISG
jgi:uroporphyrinogen-III decarboxylase